MKPWYVYIALLEDGRFYVGMTQVHPFERAHRHQTGWGGTFTKGIRVVRILWFEEHSTGSSARKREFQIKRWSHAKKQALIDGDLTRLKSLARSKRKGEQEIRDGKGIPHDEAKRRLSKWVK